jgi:hypothetical protein
MDEKGTGRVPAEAGIYLSTGQARSIRAVGVVAIVLALCFVVAPDNKVVALPFEALVAVLGAWLFFKVSRCGVYLEDGGVCVRNPLSTMHLRWSEIEEFVFHAYGACQVKRIGGRSIGIFGLQQSAWSFQRGTKGTQTALLIDELNALVAEHRPTTV